MKRIASTVTSTSASIITSLDGNKKRRRTADDDDDIEAIVPISKVTDEAENSSSSPLFLLRVLPFIISSGFLCKWEFFTLALSCKSVQGLWVAAQHTLPAASVVDIRVENIDQKQRDRPTYYPLWATQKGLENIIKTPAFGRTIFNKLCELKIAIETTERKKERVRAALPKWVDVVGITILVWRQNIYNSGGMALRFKTLDTHAASISCIHTNSYDRVVTDMPGWNIRVDRNLCLWTWGRFQKWKRTYDGEPLWTENSFCKNYIHSNDF